MIPLGNGKFAEVDEEDLVYLLLISRSWWLNDKGYAIGYVAGKKRQIQDVIAERMGIKGELIDHKDLNKLNNRRENLRPATKSQNNTNRSVQANNKLGLKGVRYRKDRNKYEATITINGKTKYLGLYDTAEEASGAYEKAAKEAFGDFARA